MTTPQLRRPSELYRPFAATAAVIGGLALLLSLSACAVLTGPVSPESLCIGHTEVNDDRLVLSELTHMDSATYLKSYRTWREDDTVYIKVKMYLPVVTAQGRDRFDRIEIPLKPSDKRAVVTDGEKKRTIWER